MERNRRDEEQDDTTNQLTQLFRKQRLSKGWWFSPRHCCLVIYCCIASYLKTWWLRLTTTFLCHHFEGQKFRQSSTGQFFCFTYDIDRSHSVRDSLWSVVRNSPASAEDVGSEMIPQSRGSQSVGQLSPSTTIKEPTSRACEPELTNLYPRAHHNMISYCREKSAHQGLESMLAATRESMCPATKT